MQLTGCLCMADRMFVCGVQDACVWLTGCLCVADRMFVCGVQDACVWLTGCLCLQYIAIQ